MAPPSFSPDASISSHTLSVGSAPPMPAMDPEHSSTTQLASLLLSPASLLQPSTASQASVLSASKHFLDHVAAAVSETQAQRQHELRKKRKRGADYDLGMDVLNLKRLHLEGFAVNQVFEQGRKILEGAIAEVALSLPDPDGRHSFAQKGTEQHEEIVWSAESSSEGSGGEEGSGWEDDNTSEDLADDREDLSTSEGLSDGGESEHAEGIFSDGQEESQEDEEDKEEEEEEEESDVAETYHPDPHGLNDGFFSIDDFNKRSEFLEQQDARGEVADDEEEDEIIWDADPFLAGKSNKVEDDGDGFSNDESEDGGPTFGNADLNAPESDSEDELLEDAVMDDAGDMSNANNIMYADFFAPPAKASAKNKKKRGRPNPHNFPDQQGQKRDMEDDDIERTMSAVHRDLFEDEDDAQSEGDLTDLDPSDPKSRQSTHERRQAKLADDIRRLEAANVAKRQWQLSGEARANDRPLNSLLEEDLDFERAGKPVPVITAEVREDLDALIKRRILAGDFDEVRRRRPEDLATGPKVRRGQFELDDTKSGKGLAEIYEEEHLRQTDPNFVDARDEKLKKEHAEIEALWKNIRGKLDSLSSWHYKPKPAAPNLEIRVDAPAIEMEDARPTAAGEVAGASMLAPQELYRPGEEKTKAEIVTKGGMPFSREEMTREQKLRRRRREKTKLKKANANEPVKESGAEKKSKEKKQLIGDLKKGGVQVIGKKGQVTDVEGRQIKDKSKSGAGNFKL